MIATKAILFLLVREAALKNSSSDRTQYLPSFAPGSYNDCRGRQRGMLPFDNRRTAIRIVSEILGILRLGEAGKTEVMYTVKLSYHQTQTYLGWLSDIGLIRQIVGEGDTTRYRITSNGLDLLGKIEQVQEMLRVDEVPAILTAPRLSFEEKPKSGITRRLRGTFHDGR